MHFLILTFINGGWFVRFDKFGNKSPIFELK